MLSWSLQVMRGPQLNTSELWWPPPPDRWSPSLIWNRGCREGQTLHYEPKTLPCVDCTGLKRKWGPYDLVISNFLWSLVWYLLGMEGLSSPFPPIQSWGTSCRPHVHRCLLNFVFSERWIDKLTSSFRNLSSYWLLLKTHISPQRSPHRSDQGCSIPIIMRQGVKAAADWQTDSVPHL